MGDSQTVGERRDTQQVQQRSLGRTDLVTGLNDLDVRDNLDKTSGNLGWDTQSLEERGLTWLHTGVTGWDPDVLWSNGTGLSWGSNNVRDNSLSDGLQVRVGEDETNVTLDERQQLFILRQLRQETSDGSSDHGVLTHQDSGLTSQGLSGLVHLLGRDIVDTNNEDRLVFGQQLLQLSEVLHFLVTSSTHFDYYFFVRSI